MEAKLFSLRQQGFRNISESEKGEKEEGSRKKKNFTRRVRQLRDGEQCSHNGQGGIRRKSTRGRLLIRQKPQGRGEVLGCGRQHLEAGKEA